jgi:deoxyribodipyrimidine photo-lyase
MPAPIILWFRQDLRLSDNPALDAAIQTGAPIIPVYILDDITPGRWKMGAASRVWLHHSLLALNASLNNSMIFATGAADDVIPRLVEQTSARGVYWNRCYEPFAVARDTKIKDALTRAGRDAKSFNASLLFEPWEVLKDDGTPYKVFTPFWRRGCMGKVVPMAHTASPLEGEVGQRDRAGRVGGIKTTPTLTLPPSGGGNSSALPSLSSLNLLPTSPRWDTGMIAHWTPGENGARARFHHFLDHGLLGYKDDRNRPDRENVSRLSPHLHFGEISPREIYHAANNAAAADPRLTKDADHFLSELGWREFSYNLLYHNPSLPERPLQTRFEQFPWIDDADALHRWQRGMTGVPIVDAGMRELWATGYMHNRVRMIVGSYLVKNLLTHWTHGEDWFWDTLVDADLANNAASWQWIAGCGADAAPYFRIFNPSLQAEKFDPDGVYIRRWVPEFDTPAYPSPIIDHATARDRALQAFARTKA